MSNFKAGAGDFSLTDFAKTQFTVPKRLTTANTIEGGPLFQLPVYSII